MTAELFDRARVVLLQAPKGLDELAEWVGLIARHAEPAVRVFLGGRVKYLSRAMNDVLGAGIRDGDGRIGPAEVPGDRGIRAAAERRTAVFPRREWHADSGIWVCAHGGAFAGTRIDIGTRRLLGVLTGLPDVDAAIDLGCGTGVLASRWPGGESGCWPATPPPLRSGPVLGDGRRRMGRRSW